jgi:hypothetical protein
MSYESHAALANDGYFRQRIAAAAADEVPKTHQPLDWAHDHAWWVAGAPGFAAAYESALAADPPVPNPGTDPAVISDTQILGAVQALIAELQPQGA